MALTLKLLERLCEEFSIDKGRWYIMGLSMGGFGAWDAIARCPELFAAAAPMCSGGDEQLASRLVNLPIWCFHGAKDPIVKVENSRRMIEAIRRAGGNPKYTEYPDAGHDCWTPASREPDLLPWLFAQRREAQAP
jgi:predicted peptidase